MIDMVGIGPFVVLPLVMKSVGGPHFLLAWALGALISIIDALVWSELGAAFPQAGGSYQFLKISYGDQKWGKLLSFLYVWQTLIQAPLVVASGAIGFAQYASYLYPLDEITRRIVSGTVVLLVIALLYRRIDSIGRISVLLWLCVLGTMGWLIVGGLMHGTESIGTLLSDAWTSAEAVSPTVLAASIGVASVKTIYCYLGYYNICHLGGEIQKPERNIPLSMFLSVIGIAVLYGLLNLSVASVLPFEQAANSPFIVSTMVEALYGSGAARFATLLVLVVAFSSLFAVLLRSPWWISFALAGGFALASKALLPPQYVVFGALGGFPFVVIGVIAAWKQFSAPSTAHVEATLAQIAAMPWRDFSAAVERAFARDGYEVQRLNTGGADFLLRKSGRTTLVACKRWKAVSHGVEPLRALGEATKARDASHSIYVTLADVGEKTRRYAVQNKVELLQGNALAQLLGVLAGSKKS